MDEYLGGLLHQCFTLLLRELHLCRLHQVIAESNPKVHGETDGDFGEVKRVDRLRGDCARERGVRPAGKGAVDEESGDSKAYLQKADTLCLL